MAPGTGAFDNRQTALENGAMDPSSNRRRFFREALGQIVGPVADWLERREARRAQWLLRPPGAVPEADFGSTCQRCHACIRTCPAHCIRPAEAGDDRPLGTPVIDADVAACVVCEGLQCTHVCPSGALRPLAEPLHIRMGVAEVYHAVCVRSEGEECTKCVDLCPIGPAAIRFPHDGPPEVLEACVGCGICQLYCPTTPKAIVVRPLA